MNVLVTVRETVLKKNYIFNEYVNLFESFVLQIRKAQSSISKSDTRCVSSRTWQDKAWIYPYLAYEVLFPLNDEYRQNFKSRIINLE